MSDFSFPWTKKPKVKDSIYFNSKNSEITELTQQLESMKIDSQKEAMKEIIAGMTIGKDVSPLFPHVVNCMRTLDIELKKLIYLYIINFAKVKPSESILAVNSFLIDASNKNSPLIRSLAIRTMGCIRVEEIISYLCDTLKNALNDSDAYVRKTSCICVAKLFNTCPELVKDNGLIDKLIEMLDDGNANVLSSVIVSLMEISLLSGEFYFKIDKKLFKKMLIALNEANEWGQIYILDGLMKYKWEKKDKNKKKENENKEDNINNNENNNDEDKDNEENNNTNIHISSKKSEQIIEAVIPLFSHINPAVIMSAIKVVLKYLDYIEDSKKVQNYSKKLSMSLITLMDSVPEIRYLLLRAMHCIIQKRPYLFDKDFKSFFIKAYEPIYVKFEKLDILYKLCDNSNYEMILNEFKSYSILEYDVELVNKAIKYIGLIGYRFENSLRICVSALEDLFNYNQDFTINQGVIVMRDLMRKYNGIFKGTKKDEDEEKVEDDKHKTKNKKLLKLLKIINLQFLEKISLPESKAAVLYIIGEYSENIKNSTELINFFTNEFLSFTEDVQLQILNASIKNFLYKPEEKGAETLCTDILQKAVENCFSADVRDKAYFYWRLLESDPDLAKEMMCCDKEGFVVVEDEKINQELCDDILENITNISCIYHCKETEVIKKEDLLEGEETEEDTNVDSKDDKEKKEKKKKKKKEKSDKNDKEEAENNNEDNNDEDKEEDKKIKKHKKKKAKIHKDKANQNDVDLLGLNEIFSSSTNTNNTNNLINIDNIDNNINNNSNTNNNEKNANNNDDEFSNNVIS